MKKDKNKKKKRKYMGGGMMPMAYEDGGKFKMQSGESVDGMEMKDWIKAGIVAIAVIFIISSIGGGA
jgi:hypothetical protein